MRKIMSALMLIILVSCNSSKKSSNSPELGIVNFTKVYRDYFTRPELMDQKNAAFLNDKELELVGLPANTKGLYFEDYYMVEGNWEHITIKAGAYGRVMSMPGDDEFNVQFDFKKDSIQIPYLLGETNDNGNKYYWSGPIKDPSPKISPAILEKYTFLSDHGYVNYRGGKYYFIQDKHRSILRVNRKYLHPKETIIKGFKN